MQEKENKQKAGPLEARGSKRGTKPLSTPPPSLVFSPYEKASFYRYSSITISICPTPNFCKLTSSERRGRALSGDSTDLYFYALRAYR